MTQPEPKSVAARENIIRQLEQFSVEVLEAALLVLQVREAKASDRQNA